MLALVAPAVFWLRFVGHVRAIQAMREHACPRGEEPDGGWDVCSSGEAAFVNWGESEWGGEPDDRAPRLVASVNLDCASLHLGEWGGGVGSRRRPVTGACEYHGAWLRCSWSSRCSCC